MHKFCTARHGFSVVGIGALREMKQSMKKLGKALCCLLLCCTLLAGACLGADVDLSSAVQKSAAYMLKTVKTPQVGSIGGEWAVLGLARSGCAVPQSYWDSYYAAVEQYVKDCKGVLHEKKYTEYSRLVVALTAIGADPTNVGGYNLLTPLGDFDKTVWQGINGPVWALIALDCGNYEMPVSANAKTGATRQKYVDEILSRQNRDGGWSLTGKGGSNTSDPDITAMALQALAKYQSQSKVKAATNKALTRLSKMQDSDGGYASWKTANSESVVQVIVALCELGIRLDDARFVKKGHTLLSNLLSYRRTDGSFVHTSGENGNDQMASEQGLYGLVAAKRAKEGKNSLYRMGDCAIRISESKTAAGLPDKHPDVKKTAVTAAGKTFADIKGHTNRSAIEALTAREIISGITATSYAPNETMTRAQFAAIVVKALGLKPKAVSAFKDVASGQWFAAYVGTAYTYGIVTGKTKTTFDPNGTISRQEAAVMVARAAKLCGMDTKRNAAQIRNTLAQFSDYVTIESWAQEAMAFCYGEKILDPSDLNTEPKRAIRRGEIAQMIYELLKGAKLL